METGVTTGLSEDTSHSLSSPIGTLVEALSSPLRLLVPVCVDCLERALEDEGCILFLCLPRGPAQSLIYCRFRNQTELQPLLKAERLYLKYDFTHSAKQVSSSNSGSPSQKLKPKQEGMQVGPMKY